MEFSTGPVNKPSTVLPQVVGKYNFETGEIKMTAEAGQTRTKIPIVNSKLNNDSSNHSDSFEGILLLEHEGIATSSEAIDYIHPVLVPPTWRDQPTDCDSINNSSRLSLKSVVVPTQWPIPSSITSESKQAHAPLYKRRFVKLALNILRNRQSQ